MRLTQRHIEILRIADQQQIPVDCGDATRDELAAAGCVTYCSRRDPPGWYVTVIGGEHVSRAPDATLFDLPTRNWQLATTPGVSHA
jgi:hypothetical protein